MLSVDEIDQIAASLSEPPQGDFVPVFDSAQAPRLTRSPLSSNSSTPKRDTETKLDWLDDMWGAAKRGWLRGMQTVAVEGGLPVLGEGRGLADADIKEISRLQKEIEDLPLSKDWDNLRPRGKDESLLDASWRAIRSYASPKAIKPVAELVIESLASQIPVGVRKVPAAIGAGVAGGAAIGSVVPGAGTAAGAGLGLRAGFAGGVGLTSAALEYTGKFLESLAESGADLKDEKSLAAALQNKELVDKARSVARKKGLTIGAFDTVSALIGGKLVTEAVKKGGTKEIVKASAKELGVQAGLGATGEAAGELAAGERLDPFAIAAEAVAEIPGGAVEVAGSTAARLAESKLKEPERVFGGKDERDREIRQRLQAVQQEEAQRKTEEPREVQVEEGSGEAAPAGGILQAPQTLTPGSVVTFQNPQGQQFRFRYDGEQDFSALGRGIIRQFTPAETVPGVIEKDSTTYEAALTDAGLTIVPPEKAQPTVSSLKTVTEPIVGQQPGTPAAPTIIAEATGPGLDELFRDPRLPQGVGQLLSSLRSDPNLAGLNWNQVKVRLQSHIAEAPGSLGRQLGSVLAFTKEATPETAAEEVFHLLSDLLPDESSQRIETLRQEAVQQELTRDDLTPEQRDFLESLQENPASSTQAIETTGGAEWLPDFYHLINDKEFLGEYASGRLVARSLKNDSPTFLQQIKDWLAGVVRAVRLYFNRGDLDDIYQGILAGQIKLTPLTGQALEAKEPALAIATKASRVRSLISQAPTPEEQEAIALSAGTQATTLLSAIKRVADRLGIGDEEQRALGVTELMKIAYEAGMVTSPQEWDQMKAALTTAPTSIIATVAKDTNERALYFGIKVEALKRRAAKLAEAVGSDKFAKLVQKRDAAAAMEELREEIEKTYLLQTATEIAQSQKAITELAIGDARVTELGERIAELEELKSYANQISSIFNDVVQTLMRDKTPEGLAILQAIPGGTITPEKIAAKYRDMKRTLGQPLDRRGYLVGKLAAELMVKNSELVNRVSAIADWQQNQSIQSQMNEVEKELMASLKKNPAAAIRKVLKQAASKRTLTDRASAAWLALNRKVENKLRDVSRAGQAVILAKAVWEDPDFRRMIAETGSIVGSNPIPPGAVRAKAADPRIAIATPRFYLPDGSVQEARLAPDKKEMEVEQGKLNKIAQTLSDWLDEDANANDPYRWYYETQLAQINNLYRSSIIRHVPKIIALFRNVPFLGRNWEMFRFIISDIAIPAAQAVSQMAQNWSASHEWFQGWEVKTKEKLKGKIIAAAKSHGLIAEAEGSAGIYDWYDEVGRFINSWAQVHGKTPTLGMLLPSGRRVSQADMNYLMFQHDSVQAAYRNGLAEIKRTRGVQSQVLVEVNRALKLYRDAVESGPLTLPGHIGWRGTEFIRGYLRAKALGPAELMAHLDANWRFIQSWLEDRRGDWMKTRSPFHDLYLEAARLITELNRAEVNGDVLPEAPTNMAQLIAFVDRHSLLDTTESVSTAILSEIDSLIAGMEKTLKTTKPQEGLFDVHVVEQQNSFTRPRGQRLGPDYFYDYGLFDDLTIRSFADGASGFHFNQFATALNSLIIELRAIKSDLNRKLGDASQDAKRVREVKKENRERLHLGETFADYDRVDRQLKELETFQDRFQKAYALGGERAIADISKIKPLINVGLFGVLMSGFVQIGNFFGGSTHLGMIMGRMENAMISATAKGVVRYILPKLIYTIGGTLTHGMTRAIGKVFSPNQLDALDELYNAQFRLGKTYKRLDELGFALEAPVADKIRNQMALASTYGEIARREFPNNIVARGLEKAMMAGLSMTDALANAVGAWLQPRPIDNILNAGVVEYATDSLANLEAHLRYVFATYEQVKKDTNTDRWNLDDYSDPANALTPTEVLGSFLSTPSSGVKIKPKGLALKPGSWTLFKPNNNAYNQILTWFNTMGGVPFQETVMDYFARLRAAKPEERASVRWLTPGQVDNLATRMAEEVNKATPLNRPVFMARNANMQLIFMLKGWGFNAMRKTGEYYGHAASDPEVSYLKLVTGAAMFGLMVTAVGGMVGSDMAELFKRWWARFIRGEERGTKMWWEVPEWREKIILLGQSWTSVLPFVNDVYASMMINTPNRPTASLNPLILSKIKDIGNYVGGIARSGDWSYGLDRLARIAYSEAPTLVNQLPAYEGQVDVRSAGRLLARVAPADMVESKPFNTSPTVTPLTPLIERAVNAIGRGDFDSLMRFRGEAIDRAEEMGRLDPAKSVDASILARNPLDSKFKRKPTPIELEGMLSQLTPGQRQRVEDVLAKFETARAMLNPGKIPSVYVPPYRAASSGGTRRTAIPAELRSPVTQRTSRASRGRRFRPTLTRVTQSKRIRLRSTSRKRRRRILA